MPEWAREHLDVVHLRVGEFAAVRKGHVNGKIPTPWCRKTAWEKILAPIFMRSFRFPVLLFGLLQQR